LFVFLVLVPSAPHIRQSLSQLCTKMTTMAEDGRTDALAADYATVEPAPQTNDVQPTTAAIIDVVPVPAVAGAAEHSAAAVSSPV
jgi:hypothetical protein